MKKLHNLAVRFGKVAHNGTEEIVHFHELPHEIELYCAEIEDWGEM